MDLISPAPQRLTTSPPPTPTTDFALLESQKENIRPLREGRSAATLSTLFVKEPSAAERVVNEGHAQFQKDIEEAERRDKEGEDMVDEVQDVLDLYNRYILFTIQHHPSSASHLVPLLESSTRRFLTDARYTQDIRYLKLWVTYARHVDRREEIFSFLESRDIGTRHSALYEEWATAAEGLKRYRKAEDVFRLGIARKAAPLERLKRLYKEFLARHVIGPDGTLPEDEPLPSRTPGRSILGGLGSAITSTTTIAISGAVQSTQAPKTATRNANGSKMEIFSDDKGQAEDSAASEWIDFGTRDGRRKENVVEAGPWKGEVLPQSAARGRVAPRTPKFEVFKDQAVTGDDAVRQAEDVFSRSKHSTTEAELLKSDPLRYYDTSSLSTAIPALPTLPPPPSARRPNSQAKPAMSSSASSSSSSLHFVKIPWECPKDGPEIKSATGKIEKRMFDWAGVYKGGEEWSFEEVRARERGLLGKRWRGDVQEWESSWHAPGSSTPKVEKKKSMPSPTVNTKLADEDVRGMFNQTIGARHRHSDSESDSDSEGSESEEEGDIVQPLPTPLPTRATMLSPAGFVPPTPTPASGHITQNRTFEPPNVFVDEPAMFNDENAIPSSAGRKINVFAETPAKTPLSSRTPLAISSSARPRAFGVLQEEPPIEEHTVRQHPPAVNIFATPALAEKRPSRSVGFQPVLEESEQVGEEDTLNAQIRDGGEYAEEEYEVDQEREMYGRRMNRFGYLNEMTPITERTCEFTQFTTRSSIGRRISVMTEVENEHGEGVEQEQAGDEAIVLTNPSDLEASRRGSLLKSKVIPDFERLQHESFGSAEGTDNHSPMSANFSCSGIEPGFQLPEGYTIQGRSEVTRTMVFVDGVEARGRVSTGSDTGAFVTATSVIPEALEIETPIPNPCIPCDDPVVQTLIAKIQPPLSSIPGFVDIRTEIIHQLDKLQKHNKSNQRRGSASSSSRASLAQDDGYILSLKGRQFEIKDKIGEGGFGAVFLAVDLAVRQAQDDMDSDDEDEDTNVLQDKSLVAIKVENPSSVWEFVMLSRIHSRISEEIRRSIISAQNLYAFSDESYLLIDYCSQGTLLDVVNKAVSIGIAPAVSGTSGGVDELVAIFFIVELLKIVENLHQKGFIHGDLKIDNCLIRLEDIPSSQGGPSSWSSTYHSDGQEGWSFKGLKLIDFGRGIDFELFERGRSQRFVADWKVDERDCWEVREGREWAWESDYYGLAGVAYCLLFGKYIQSEMVEGTDEGTGKKYKISTPLKRYWQTTLWNELFDLLLNPVKDQLPVTHQLTEIRQKFETWLEDNCQKGGKNLKAMLKKIELGALVRR